MYLLTKCCVHAAQAMAIVDTTAPTRRKTSDVGVDAIDPAEPALALVGELVAAAEFEEDWNGPEDGKTMAPLTTREYL